MDLAQEFLDDLYIAFQPIMLCSNITRIEGYEILLRSKKQGGFPEKIFAWFIEDDHRNARLMDYYLQELYTLRETHSDIRLSLNLHPQQLQHPSTWDFLNNISAIKKTLEIELTEHYCEFSPLNREDHLEAFLSKLKEQGFSVAIDDVGTGQNNFEMVTRNVENISTIKISLLKFRNLNEAVLYNFLNSWLFLSEHYQIKLIVEGIESESISTKLKNLGLIYQQGYYHGKAKVLS